MSAKSRATQHHQWAVNAIVAAMQSASSVDQEVLFMIARKHLTRAQKADHTRNPEPDGLPGRAKSRPTGQCQSETPPAGSQAALAYLRHRPVANARRSAGRTVCRVSALVPTDRLRPVRPAADVFRDALGAARHADPRHPFPDAARRLRRTTGQGGTPHRHRGSQ